MNRQPRSRRLPTRLPPRAERDAGSVVIEVAVFAVVLIAILFGIVQAGFWFHARTIALRTAAVALDTASTTTGTDDAARADALAFWNQAGGNASLTSPGVVVRRTPGTVIVTVTGTSISFLPDHVLPEISVTVTGPTERFTTPRSR